MCSKILDRTRYLSNGIGVDEKIYINYSRLGKIILEKY